MECSFLTTDDFTRFYSSTSRSILVSISLRAWNSFLPTITSSLVCFTHWRHFSGSFDPPSGPASHIYFRCITLDHFIRLIYGLLGTRCLEISLRQSIVRLAFAGTLNLLTIICGNNNKLLLLFSHSLCLSSQNVTVCTVLHCCELIIMHIAGTCMTSYSIWRHTRILNFIRRSLLAYVRKF